MFCYKTKQKWILITLSNENIIRTRYGPTRYYVQPIPDILYYIITITERIYWPIGRNDFYILAEVTTEVILCDSHFIITTATTLYTVTCIPRKMYVVFLYRCTAIITIIIK